MKKSVTVNWKQNMAFEAKVGEHKLMLDADTGAGGENLGARPKPLMMVALAGCTGMDVVSILKKMKIEVSAFNVEVEGNLTEEHPMHFDAMHIIYRFGGQQLPLEKINHAITLSLEKYCGVAAVYKKTMPVTWEVQLTEE